MNKTLVKTLVKTKIVLEDNGKTLTTYFWKRTFLCFGYWYPFGTSCGESKQKDNKVNKINDKNVSKILFDEFINH